MTGIGTHLAKQRADGVILAAGAAVEPSLDRRIAKSDRLAGDRMLPFLRGLISLAGNLLSSARRAAMF
jgi:hypothetical protein